MSGKIFSSMLMPSSPHLHGFNMKNTWFQLIFLSQQSSSTFVHHVVVMTYSKSNSPAGRHVGTFRSTTLCEVRQKSINSSTATSSGISNCDFCLSRFCQLSGKYSSKLWAVCWQDNTVKTCASDLRSFAVNKTTCRNSHSCNCEVQKPQLMSDSYDNWDWILFDSSIIFFRLSRQMVEMYLHISQNHFDKRPYLRSP